MTIFRPETPPPPYEGFRPETPPLPPPGTPPPSYEESAAKAAALAIPIIADLGQDQSHVVEDNGFLRNSPLTIETDSLPVLFGFEGEERDAVLDELKAKIYARLKKEGIPKEVVENNPKLLEKMEMMAEEEGTTELHIIGSIVNDARTEHLFKRRQHGEPRFFQFSDRQILLSKIDENVFR